MLHLVFCLSGRERNSPPELRNVGLWYFSAQKWMLMTKSPNSGCSPFLYIFPDCRETLLFCLVKGFFILTAVRHETLHRSNLTSCNPVSLILFGTVLLRWVTVESWHNSAEGHSIRSYAHTLMWMVAQAQRNSSVVCSRGDTWDKVTLNYWSTHQSLPLESVSHLFIGLSLQQGHTKQVCFKPDLPRSKRVSLSLVRGCWCCTAQCPLSLILAT